MANSVGDERRRSLWPRHASILLASFLGMGCRDNAPKQGPKHALSQASLSQSPAEEEEGVGKGHARAPVDQGQCLADVSERFGPVLGEVWLPDPEDMYPDPVDSEVNLIAQKYASRIRAQATTASTVIAYARRGAVLPSIKTQSGRGCGSGKWHEVQGGGYVCAGKDFSVLESKKPTKPYFQEGHHLPYRYAKLNRGRHPIFSRLPSRKELNQVLAAKARKSRKFPSSVKGVSDGLQFETVVGEHTIQGHKLYQNAKGNWFLAQDAKMLNPPVGHGVFLTDQINLPLAYIRHKDTPIRCDCSGTLQDCGKAQKHDVVEIYQPKAGEPAVQLRTAGQDIRVARQDVRVARREKRPSTIPAGAKWIHVRLSEQTLVAYEGDLPVFATIVATGAKGHETKPGTFRTQRKFVSTTMRGQDDEFGRYTVSDVPWTLFYDGSFALHGAYWHDTFGDVRSHGCTNIPPNDARWLFHWSSPELPVGWHGWGGVREGTYVYVSEQ